jgi:hypothetical protein
MPEVSVGLGLERFTLLAQGVEYGVVDILENDTASILLTALPDFPLEVHADMARKFVAAWRQRETLKGQGYAVQEEQRAL